MSCKVALNTGCFGGRGDAPVNLARGKPEDAPITVRTWRSDLRQGIHRGAAQVKHRTFTRLVRLGIPDRQSAAPMGGQSQAPHVGLVQRGNFAMPDCRCGTASDGLLLTPQGPLVSAQGPKGKIIAVEVVVDHEGRSKFVALSVGIVK